MDAEEAMVDGSSASASAGMDVDIEAKGRARGGGGGGEGSISSETCARVICGLGCAGRRIMMGGLALVGTLPADVFDITGVRRAAKLAVNTHIHI